LSATFDTRNDTQGTQVAERTGEFQMPHEVLSNATSVLPNATLSASSVGSTPTATGSCLHRWRRVGQLERCVDCAATCSRDRRGRIAAFHRGAPSTRRLFGRPSPASYSLHRTRTVAAIRRLVTGGIAVERTPDEVATIDFRQLITKENRQ
jgi:hypothetical protein